jgi:hypothetical protein
MSLVDCPVFLFRAELRLGQDLEISAGTGHQIGLNFHFSDLPLLSGYNPGLVLPTFEFDVACEYYVDVFGLASVCYALALEL